MAEMNFDGMGHFIYGAFRHGGDRTDVTDWMADDLGVARPLPDDDHAARELYRAFFVKYPDTDSLRENHERFITMLRNRPPSAAREWKEAVPMRTDAPKFIASERILWIRSDGTEQVIEVRIGEPYQRDAQSWACPACLDGVDGRYPDIVGANSLQSLTLALRLVASRLGHLLADGEQLVYPDDRHPWDLSTLSAS